MGLLATLLGTVRRADTTPPDRSTVEEHTVVLRALRTRLDAFEQLEATRAAEHALMVDRLDRLYKRISARIARESHDAGNGESTLDLKRRLRG